jgi:hypothetical protein
LVNVIKLITCQILLNAVIYIWLELVIISLNLFQSDYFKRLTLYFLTLKLVHTQKKNLNNKWLMYALTYGHLRTKRANGQNFHSIWIIYTRTESFTHTRRATKSSWIIQKADLCWRVSHILLYTFDSRFFQSFCFGRGTIICHQKNLRNHIPLQILPNLS